MMKRKKLLSLELSMGRYADLLATIASWAGRSAYICVSNVHMLVEAHKDPAFASVVNGADMATPDGMPLAKAFELLYGIRQDRAAGMDLLPDLLAVSAQRSIPVFFYGGTPEMQEKTKAYCEAHYPDLRIAGQYSPPFRSLTQEEERDAIDRINGSGAGFVFVALGCPKQEKWMAAMKGKVQACMLGIGGALPVMVGMQKRAPRWMQRYCLEWLFRLGQEPRRLFKRYAYTNTLFLYLLFKQWGKQGFRALK